MNATHLLAELRSERTRVDRAIAALEALDSAPARTTRGTPERGRLSA